MKSRRGRLVERGVGFIENLAPSAATAAGVTAVDKATSPEDFRKSR